MIKIWISFITAYVLYAYHRLIGYEDIFYYAFTGTPYKSNVLYSFMSIIPTKVVRLPNSLYTNTKSYRRVFINGDYLANLDINDEDEWLATKIDHTKPITTQVKANDIVFIYCYNEECYITRQVQQVLDDETIDVYSPINKDKLECYPACSIRGILKYKI